jgi:hypothetical protein
MPTAMQVINAGLYADRIVETVLKWQAAQDHVNKQQNRHSCKEMLRNAGFKVLGAGFYGFVVDGPADSEFVVKVCIDATDGYPMYAKWAKANPQPGIMPVWLAERITDTCFFAVIPRLKELDNYSEKYQPYAVQARQAVMDALDNFANEDLHDGNWMQMPDGTIVISDPFAGLYVDAEKAESTAARGAYTPPLKDQFDLFSPTLSQQVAINEAKTIADRLAGVRPRLTGQQPMARNLAGGTAFRGGAFLPPPGALPGCDCPICKQILGSVKRAANVVKPRSALAANQWPMFNLPKVEGGMKPGVFNAMIQGFDGRMADLVILDDPSPEQVRRRDELLGNAWFVQGRKVGRVTFQAWDIAKPLMYSKQEPDGRLLSILSRAADRYGLKNLFVNLPVHEVARMPGLQNWKAQDSNRLGMAVPIERKMELDFNELERRIMASPRGRQPHGRFDVRNFPRLPDGAFF